MSDKITYAKSHSGYRTLLSYKTTTLIYDLTVEFCNRYMTYKSNKSYETYSSYLSKPEEAANCLICLIHQACFLLDRQLQALEKAFIAQGGYSKNLFRRRLEYQKT